MMYTRAEVKGDPFICNKMTLETYHCKFCDFKSDLKVNLTAHLRLVHEGKETNDDLDRILECYRCENCDFKTHSLVLLAQHTYNRCTSDFKPHLTENHPECQNSNVALLPKKCKHCYFETRFGTSLRRHIATKHTNTEDVVWHRCGHCEYKTNIKHSLNEHILRRHPKPEDMIMLMCEHCSYETRHKIDLMKHMKYRHAKLYNSKDIVMPKDVSKCLQCSYKSISKVDLIKHIFTEHKGQTHNIQGIVSHCPKMDVTLVKHMKSCESNIPKVYKCRSCHFKTDFKVVISYHTRVVHDRINFGKLWEVMRIYNCDCCEFTTSSLLILTKHSCQQHPKMILQTCKHGTFNTTQKMQLKAHMNQIHTKPDISKDIVKPQDILKCTLCSYKTTLKVNLVEHILTKHKEQIQNIQAIVNYCLETDSIVLKPIKHCESNISKAYKCRSCTFETDFKVVISYHKKVVHERANFYNFCEIMKPYSCAHCEFTTSSLLVLTKHNICRQHPKMILYKTMQQIYLRAQMNRVHAKPGISKDNVKPIDIPIDIVQPRDISKDNVKPIDIPIDIVQPRDISKDTVKPRDISIVIIKPTDISKDTVKSRGISKDIVKPKDTLQCTLQSFKTTSKASLVEQILTVHRRKTQNVQANIVFKPFKLCTSAIPKTYRCDYCNLETDLKVIISYHNRVVHERVKFCDIWELMNTYNCAHCEFTTNSLLVLTKHSCQQHSRMQLAIKCGNWFQCVQCDYKTECKETLSHHVRWKLCDEQKIKWFQCTVCVYKTKWRGDFIRHLINHPYWRKSDN